MEIQKATGLTAAQAEERAKAGLANIMPKSDGGGVGAILRRNILTLFNLLNLALAALLLWVQSYRNLLFLGVVVSNALIGTVQELRAKRTHDRLQLLSQNKVKALRDGETVALAPEDLVRDDVIFLARGDQIPGDAVVLEGAARADESILTGESASVGKAPGDTLYSGSFLVEGTVTARLTAVGAESYMGKLQLSARKVKRTKSALMGDMEKIIGYVSLTVVPIGLLLFWKQHAALGLSRNDAVVKAVAAVIGMIPEGLILLTSVSLAAGVVTLGRKKTLVNELYGIESLARTDVLCMDKTGTLTSGQMEVSQCVPLGDAEETECVRCLTALLDALGGDGPTAQALRRAYPPQGLEEAVQTIPFSSERKWSLARFAHLGTVVMGAPERLLAGDALEKARGYAAQGLRVVALLRGDAAPAEGEPALPDALRPLALFCLTDALRPQVRETVRYFQEQGVTLKVLSGDSPLTVSTVAKSAGLPGAERLIDLSALAGEKDYAALSREYTVFGRVSPEDKRELVLAMQRDGRSVAMMGDGVNDIPALKAANCSLAMAGGSDAACRVAQMTLLSGDFNAMPQILLEGRRVINNITRASSLFLVKNIFSMLVSLALLGLPFVYPFAPIQLTLVSTLTIGLPSLALALQPSGERVRGNFLRNVIARALPGGLCAAFAMLAVLLLQGPLHYGHESASTLCTLLAGYSGLAVLLFTCLPLNPLRACVAAISAGLFFAGFFCFPQVFYLVPLTSAQWLVALAAAVAIPLAQLGLGALIQGRFSREELTARA